MVLGITGGVGSGKSTVTDILRDKYGFKVLHTDDIAKELEMPGGDIYNELTSCFGTDILEGGARPNPIDKEKFARLIFSDEEAVKKANAIVHPIVWKTVRDRIWDYTVGTPFMPTQGEVPVAVETALPDEEFRNICDTVWYVFADDDTRVKRLMESRGYSEEKCRSIIASQHSFGEFMKISDELIDNSFSVEITEQMIGELLI